MYYKNIDKIVIVTNDQGTSIEMSIFAKDGVKLFHCRDEKGIHFNETVQDICQFVSACFLDFDRTFSAPNTVTLHRIYSTQKVSDNE